jgi:hypothetical protein
MPTRRQLLLSGAGLAALGHRAFAEPLPTVGAASKLLFVYAHGAWDTHYTFDPKLASPHVDGPEIDPATDDPSDVESEEVIGGHRIAVNPFRRPQVIDYFTQWGPHTLSLLGITIGGIAHYPNRLRLLTGGTARNRPDLVALVGSGSAVTEPLGAVDLSGWSFHGPHGATMSRAGFRWQLSDLLLPGDQGLGNGLPLTPHEDDLVEDYLRRRAAERQQRMPDVRWNHDLQNSVDRLELIRDGREELAGLFDRNSRSPDDNLELAVDLLSRGWARSVLVDTRYYFDTHAGNAGQSSLNDDLFGSLSRMMQRLSDTGQLDDTLVVVSSEMTRSPKQGPTGGKDHWPLVAYLLMGAGIAGGRTLGATDDRVAPLPVDLHTGQRDDAGDLPRYDQVYAGLVAHLGLDPAEHSPGIQPLGGFAG